MKTYRGRYEVVGLAKLTNRKREMFCQEWLIDLNATQAAIRAGYSKNTSNEQGARLLSVPEVQVRIAELTEDRANRLQITQDKILEELKVIAFSKITDYLKIEDIDVVVGYEQNDEGKPDKNKPKTRQLRKVTILTTDEMPQDKIRAIAQIKETRDGIVLKLHDKSKALEDLMKHLGMFTDKETLKIKKQELELKGW